MLRQIATRRLKNFFPASLALREQDRTVLPISTKVAEEFVWWRDRFVEEQRILAKLSGGASRRACLRPR